MSEHKDLRGVIGDWRPPQDSLSTLEKYLQKLKEKLSQDAFFTIQSWKKYVENFERHTGRIQDFLLQDNYFLSNLVLGNVQSGKTGHMMASVAWAADNQFDLVIMLNGNKLTLNSQTISRVNKDLGSAVQIVGVRTKSNSSESDAFNDEISRLVDCRHKDSNNALPLAVLIKTPQKVLSLSSALSNIVPESGRKLRVLVLDDEADQASPNATLGHRASGRRKTSTNSVHNSLKTMAESINGKVIYLSYTATPQALMHQDRGTILMPKYCSIVPSGPSYFGLADLFATQNCIADLDSLENAQNGTADERRATVLSNIFIEFLVKSWTHKRFASVFHNGSLCSESSVQMLVHPSGNQNDQKVIANEILEFRKHINDILTDEQLRPDYLDKQVRPLFASVMDNLGYHQDLSGYLPEFLDYFWELVRNKRKLRVLIVNTNQRSKLKASGQESEFLPVEDEDWNKADAWILVGGDILGRGLTIPHLLTTYFLRNPKSPTFDTSVQQMRFCGYRRSYSKSVRVYAPNDVLRAYEDNLVSDSQFRFSAEQWDEENRDLENYPPKIIHIRPEGSRVKATRAAVISSQVKVSSKNRTDGFFTNDTILDFTSTVAKANGVFEFTQKYGKSIQVNGSYTVPSQFFGLLLESLIEPELQTNFIALQELATDLERLHEVVGGEFEIHLSPNFGLSSMEYSIENIAKQVSNSNLDESRVRTADFVLDTGNFDKWVGHHTTPTILGHIRAVVGDSERAARRGKEDKTIVLVKNFAVKDSADDEIKALSCSVNVWLPNGAPVISIHNGG